MDEPINHKRSNDYKIVRFSSRYTLLDIGSACKCNCDFVSRGLLEGRNYFIDDFLRRPRGEHLDFRSAHSASRKQAHGRSMQWVKRRMSAYGTKQTLKTSAAASSHASFGRIVI